MQASRFLSGFYIVNVASLLLYFLPRTLFVLHPDSFHASFPSVAAFVLRVRTGAPAVPTVQAPLPSVQVASLQERQAFGLLALSSAFKV